MSRKDGMGWGWRESRPRRDWQARMKGLLHHGEGLVLVLQAQTLQNQGKEPGQTILRKNTWGKKTGVMSTWMMPLGTDNRDYILESSTADCTGIANGI